MKTGNQTAYRSRLPLLCWIFTLGAFLTIACFARPLATHWQSLLSVGVPYLLLGLACHSSRHTAETRVLGFALSIIPIIIPLFFIILFCVLATLGFTCPALGIALRVGPLLLILLWIYSISSSLALLVLGKRLRKKQGNQKSFYNGEEP